MDAPDLHDAITAEVAFYRALAHVDFALMQAVWADGEAVGCIHPGWPALRGRTAVLDSFRRMFDAGQRLDLRVERLSATPLGDGVIHLAHEFISMDGAGTGAPVVATNLYRPVDGRWRMVWHHASPTPALDLAPEVVH